MTALLAVLAAALAATLALLVASRARRRELETLLAGRGADLEVERARRAEDAAARAALEAKVDAERRAAEEKLALVRDAESKLANTFDALSSRALQANNDQFLQLARESLGRFAEAANGDLEKRQTAIAELVRPVQESLGRVDEKISKLEKSGDVTAARLTEQVRGLAAQEEKLRSETAKLSTALRSPAQRGRWGETQLRRTLELAGLRAHVDFDEQPVVQLADGALRPDVAIRLPGEKTVLLDAKVPLEAYLKAVDAAEDQREIHLRAHAAQLRAHVDSLSRKQYWEAFAGSPEMAVLFLPSEGLLSAALEVDPRLHEDAFARRIVLATPATLLALLLTIAHVWKQESIATNAREIANEGRELHKRIADLSRHLAKLGRTLESALKAYNGTVGSFDGRVLPAARRFEELKASAVDVQLEPLAGIEMLPRLPRPPGEEALPDDAN
jgi:DNA recombination protein RmuC